MWLSEEIYSKKSVQRLLELKRIVLVRVDGEPSAPPAAAAPPAPKPAPEPEPVVEASPEPEPEPAPEPEPEPEEVEEDAQEEEEEEPEPEEAAQVYTESELSALTLPYIRPIASKAGIDTSGMRKADIIQAILDSQES